MSSSIGNLTAANGLLYFTAADGLNGSELWRSDGTAEGTFMLADGTAGPTGSSLRSFTPVGNILYFVNDNTGFLWSSDGTTAGTKAVTGGFGSPNSLTNVDGTLYYVATNGINRVRNGVPQSLGFTSGQWRSTAVIAGDLYYSVDGQGVSRLSINSDMPPSLFRDATGPVQLYNATAAGTIRLQIPAPNNNGRVPTSLTSLGSKLLFVDNFISIGNEPWVSDGTAAGTTVLKSTNRVTSSQPTALTRVGSKVYFAGGNTTTGVELWVTDGTDAGTTLVKELLPGTSGSYPKNFVNVDGTLYFSANETSQDTALFKSDGTAAGTTAVRTQLITSLANVAGQLVMIANDRGDVPRIWTSDGTTIGTRIVSTPTGQNSGPIAANVISSIEEHVVVVGRTLARGDELIIVSATDMGDAATQTRYAEDGARHAALGPRLGVLRDSTENDGTQSHVANSDDLDGTDDEDGAPSSLVLPLANATPRQVFKPTAVCAANGSGHNAGFRGMARVNRRRQPRLLAPCG